MKKLLALVFLVPLMVFAGDKETCEAMDPAVDRAACMKELRNARAEKSLETNSEMFLRNRVERCRPFEGDHWALRSCVGRVLKGETDGDVARGGYVTTYKEIFIFVPKQ